MTPLI